MSRSIRLGGLVCVLVAIALGSIAVADAKSGDGDIVAGHSDQEVIDPGLSPIELQSTYAAEDETIEMAQALIDAPGFDPNNPDPALAAEVTEEQQEEARVAARRLDFTCVLTVFFPFKDSGNAHGKTRNDCSGTVTAQSITGCLSHINSQGNVHLDDCRSNVRDGPGSIQVQPTESCSNAQNRYWISGGSGIVRGNTNPVSQNDSKTAVLGCNP